MSTILQKKLFLPQHWPIWLLAGILWLLSQLPYRYLLLLGRSLGWLLMKIPSKARTTTLINLRLCFPELSEQQRYELFRKNFISVGIGVFETALAWWASKKRLHKLLKIDGLQHVANALKQDRGALIVGMHFTTLHLICRLLSLQFPLTLMYRPQKNPVLEWIANRALHKHYKNAIARHDVRGLLRSLENNLPICYTPDTDPGKKSGIFVPFFGIPAATVTATSRFAKMSQAKILLTFFERSDGGNGYRIEFSEALENFPTDNIFEDTLRINLAIEASIRRRPEQYIWQYKRFKTRPDGEARFYK